MCLTAQALQSVRYEVPPHPTLQSMDACGSVTLISTILFPSTLTSCTSSLLQLDKCENKYLVSMSHPTGGNWSGGGMLYMLTGRHAEYAHTCSVQFTRQFTVHAESGEVERECMFRAHCMNWRPLTGRSACHWPALGACRAARGLGPCGALKPAVQQHEWVGFAE